MVLNLNNKSALVCGSTQGIGRACAIALAHEGERGTHVARNEDTLKQIVRDTPKHDRVKMINF